MSNPIINVITRTSGRPNYFHLHKNYMYKQTYDNINHIVCVDDAASKEYVSQYKFIISMENTRYETGITEKITHGMLAQTVSVYWGSPRVYEYFNKERFLNLENDSIEGMNKIIEEMINIKNNDQKWLDIVEMIFQKHQL